MDLAGVLTVFDRRPRLAALARLSGLSESDVGERLYGSGFVGSADAGAVDAEGVRAGIAARLELDCGTDEMEAAWMAAFTENPAALAVLDGLQPALVVALLSNNDALVGSLLGEHLPGVVARCDAVLVTGVLRAQKPDPRAYARALEALGVAASACLFVDDSPDNVDGARAVGIDSVLYTAPAELAAEFEARGLGLAS